MDDIFYYEIEEENESETKIIANDIIEAFIKTYRYYGKYDVNMIMEITNQSQSKIERELRPILIKDPKIQEYMFIDEYLSGDLIERYQDTKSSPFHQNLIRELIDQNMKIPTVIYKRLMDDEENQFDLVKKIGYIPSKYKISGLLDVENKAYEDDYIHMLLNEKTIELSGDEAAFNEYIRINRKYLPERIVYVVVPKDLMRLYKARYKDDTKVIILNRTKLSAVVKEKVEATFLIFDLYRLNAPLGILKSLENKDHAIIFMNYLSVPLPELSLFLIHKKMESAELSTLIYFHHKLFDHSQRKEMNVSFDKESSVIFGLLNPDIEYNKNSKKLKYNALSANQKTSLRRQFSLIGDEFCKDSKLYIVAQKIQDEYLLNPNSKQLIYLDEPVNYRGIDYFQKAISVMFVDRNDIQIVKDHHVDQKCRIYFSTTKDVSPHEIKQLTKIHQLDVPKNMNQYFERIGEAENIIYYIPDSIDSSDNKEFRTSLNLHFELTGFDGYLNGRNHLYVNLKDEPYICNYIERKMNYE